MKNAFDERSRGLREPLRRRWLAGAGGLALAPLAGAFSRIAKAQGGYPTKPITVVSPFPPGGLNDTCARVVAKAIQDGLGRPAIVENRPGGGTMIAMEYVSRSAPDGHTLVICSDTNMAVVPNLATGLSFSLQNDFAPVTLLVIAPAVLVVRPGLKVDSLKDLVALAKANPGKISFASAGNATPPHMIGEMFKLRAGIDVTHIAFKGATPGLLAVMGDHVDFMFIDMASASAQVKAGKAKVLAVSTLQRARALPEVPTVAEQGYPGFEGRAWLGLAARAGTPPDIIETLNRVVVEQTKRPEVGGVFGQQGAELTTMSSQRFVAMIADERARFGQLIRSANIKLEG
jgi:tripartite-type tricarboxylate transporter receptor subunit TctC